MSTTKIKKAIRKLDELSADSTDAQALQEGVKELLVFLDKDLLKYQARAVVNLNNSKKEIQQDLKKMKTSVESAKL